VGKATPLLKFELAAIQNFGEKQDCEITASSPALPGPARPPGARFVFLGLVISLRHEPVWPAPLSSWAARAALHWALILSLFAARHLR
jgi:hypothetical protein